MAAAGASVAGCASPTTAAHTTAPPASIPDTVTTRPATDGGSTTPPATHCSSGTVAVPWQPTQGVTTVCVTVGSTVVLTGGGGMSAGTWPGPPTVSDQRVLALLSSHASGSTYTGTLRAIGAGTATVEVPFVAGPDVCDPTPCTPVPGRPLDWQVTVVP